LEVDVRVPAIKNFGELMKLFKMTAPKDDYSLFIVAISAESSKLFVGGFLNQSDVNTTS
jgi:hypothetical protein